jgi:hypothetical protein
MVLADPDQRKGLPRGVDLPTLTIYGHLLSSAQSRRLKERRLTRRTTGRSARGDFRFCIAQAFRTTRYTVRSPA